jgi:hypothetical protein
LPGCLGKHAVDDNVDGEAKPLVAIASDHLCGVGGDQREPVGRQAGERFVELVDMPLSVAAAAFIYIVRPGESVSDTRLNLWAHEVAPAVRQAITKR